MLGQLTNEQIVEAASTKYQSAVAAGMRPADALNLVLQLGVQQGVSEAQIVGAFNATGNGPALEAIYAAAFGYNPTQVAAAVDTNAQLVAEVDLLYRTRGAGVVVAQMFKRGITLEALNNAVVASGAYVAPGDANAIVNTYRAIERQSLAISNQGNVQSVAADWDRQLWTVQTYTQGAFNVPMDGASLPPAPPPPVGIQPPAMPPESQRIPVVDPLAAGAIALYNSGGAPAVVGAMLDHGITIAQLNAAFQASQVQLDPAAAAQVASTYQAITGQFTRLSNLPNVQSVRLNTATRQFTVVANTGTWVVNADGVSMPPAEATAPARPTIVAPPVPRSVESAPVPRLTNVQIVEGAVAVWNAHGGSSHPATAYRAVLAFGASQGLTEQIIGDAFSATNNSSIWTAARQIAAREGFEAAPVPAPRFVPAPSVPQGPRPPVRRASSPRNLTPAQIVLATDAIFRTQPDARSGINAVRAQAADNGYTWDQVVDAYRTVGGATWTRFQEVAASAGTPVPAEASSGLPGWFIPAALAVVSFFRQ